MHATFFAKEPRACLRLIGPPSFCSSNVPAFKNKHHLHVMVRSGILFACFYAVVAVLVCGDCIYSVRRLLLLIVKALIWPLSVQYEELNFTCQDFLHKEGCSTPLFNHLKGSMVLSSKMSAWPLKS